MGTVDEGRGVEVRRYLEFDEFWCAQGELPDLDAEFGWKKGELGQGCLTLWVSDREGEVVARGC